MMEILHDFIYIPKTVGTMVVWYILGDAGFLSSTVGTPKGNPLEVLGSMSLEPQGPSSGVICQAPRNRAAPAFGSKLAASSSTWRPMGLAVDDRNPA